MIKLRNREFIMEKQSGFTLIEIMISLILGLIVLAATISIYVATVGSSSNTIKSARLNHDLEAVMALMINDIRRAGYWGGATVTADSRNNLFTAVSTNIQIPINTCVLYSYDGGNGTTGGVPHDSNGIVDSDEYYGFKLENNTIRMRKTGTTTADCSNGTWEEFIDGDQLTITQLQFDFGPIVGVLPATSRCMNVTTGIVTNAASCESTSATYIANCTVATPCNSVQKRVVNIQLSGQLDSDVTVTKTINGTVEVRNSRLFTQP